MKLSRYRQPPLGDLDFLIAEYFGAKDPARLKIQEVLVEDRRHLVCLNEDEGAKDAHDRQAIVAHLVHQVRDWFSGVAIKMGRRQGATKEHI